MEVRSKGYAHTNIGLCVMTMSAEANVLAARVLAMRSALRLEVLGMKHSHGSVYALVKREFGFKGNKRRVLDQLSTYVDTYILPGPSLKN